MAEILILGGGMAGISAAGHANMAGREAVVFEAAERWGGLLDNFTVEGFRFDRAVHFAFSNNKPFQKVLDGIDCHVHYPEPYNYENGRWLKHPVQNNLFPLPAEEKVEAILSFIDRPAQDDDADYRDWLEQQFGKVIAKRYPGPYTEKYWTVPPEMMSTEWIGNRLYRPSLEEVLFGAMTDRTPATYYLPKMLYPKKGGFRAILEKLARGIEIRTNKKAVHIEPQKKYVDFADGSREYYNLLVSSVPLPELVKIVAGTPRTVLEAAAGLWATSIALVSLGFSKPQAGEYLWFYIYDREILPARAHAPYRKSPDNAPPGCSSLQFETYFSRYKPLALEGEALTEHILDTVEKLNLAKKKDVIACDYRVLPYGNVVFDRGMVERRNIVLKYLRDCGILSAGRFGEWDYLWSDQCFLSGRRVLEHLAML
ncbi:MAG: FAD-dependent oxidoreductase [Bacillota bacterium]|nr:FAD-dependent oxidoreductase [Bacillota bacterium]